MMARIWRTEIDETRADAYRDFARSRSLPMFRAQPGFAGALFAALGAERAVITLWHDLAAVDALEHSKSYKATVAEIEATGFLQGPSTVEVFELEEMFLERAAMSREEPRPARERWPP
jgi:heme-degrading monooxygenase HmoA